MTSIDIHVPRDVGSLLNNGRSHASELELALVERLSGGRAALPVLPAVAQAALDLVNDPDASAGEFARLVEKDPPIAARFLSVANSALYSRGRKVTSLEEAVMRLGLYGCRDLLMQVVYASTMSGLRRYQKEVQRSFDRSVLSGLICRAAAAELNIRSKEAYLCGLLHDIGESRTYRILSELPEAGDNAEVQVLVHRYHERAGEDLAKAWKLPEEIQEVCRAHHAEAALDVELSEASRLVRISDLLIEAVQQTGAGATPNWKTIDFASARYRVLGLTLGRVQAIVATASALAFKA
jgi:putative nucleotidyltransferase with HDIG domain